MLELEKAVEKAPFDTKVMICKLGLESRWMTGWRYMERIKGCECVGFCVFEFIWQKKIVADGHISPNAPGSFDLRS